MPWVSGLSGRRGSREIACKMLTGKVASTVKNGGGSIPLACPLRALRVGAPRKKWSPITVVFPTRYDFAKPLRSRRELLGEKTLPAGSPRAHRPPGVAKARSFRLRYPGRVSHSAIALRSDSLAQAVTSVINHRCHCHRHLVFSRLRG